MAERIGVCEDCSARYKIPPHITATSAKCKKCGGIVRIPAADAADEAPAPAPRPAPEKPKAAPRPRPAAKPAAPPAAKPAAEKKAAPARRAAGRGRAAAAAADDEEPAAGGRRRSAGAGAGRRGAAGAGRRGAAAGRRGRRGAAEAEDEGGGGRRGRRGAAASKGGNQNMMIAIGAGVLVLGGAVAFFMMGDDGDGKGDSDANAKTEVAENDAGTTPENPTGGGSEDPTGTGDAATGNGESTDTEGGDTTGGAESTDGGTDTTAGGTEDDTTGGSIDTEAGDDDPITQVEIPSVVEFEAFADFPGTTADEAADIAAQIGKMSLLGAARKRAIKALQEYGLKAVPPLVNTFQNLDLKEPTGLRDAFEVAVFIQDELTYKMIKIPLRGDATACENPADLEHNYKCLESLLKYVARWYDPALGETNVNKSLEIFEGKKLDAEG